MKKPKKYQIIKKKKFSEGSADLMTPIEWKDPYHTIFWNFWIPGSEKVPKASRAGKDGGRGMTKIGTVQMYHTMSTDLREHYKWETSRNVFRTAKS